MTVVDPLGYDTTRTDPDDALRDLLERQHLIVEMQQTQGFRLWTDFLSAVATGYQNRLLQGRHTDMYAYKRDAGIVEGLRLALTSADTLQQRVNAARRLLAEQNLADLMEEQDEPA